MVPRWLCRPVRVVSAPGPVARVSGEPRCTGEDGHPHSLRNDEQNEDSGYRAGKESGDAAKTAMIRRLCPTTRQIPRRTMPRPMQHNVVTTIDRDPFDFGTVGYRGGFVRTAPTFGTPTAASESCEPRRHRRRRERRWSVNLSVKLYLPLNPPVFGSKSISLNAAEPSPRPRPFFAITLVRVSSRRSPPRLPAIKNVGADIPAVTHPFRAQGSGASRIVSASATHLETQPHSVGATQLMNPRTREPIPTIVGRSAHGRAKFAAHVRSEPAHSEPAHSEPAHSEPKSSSDSGGHKK